MLISLGFMEFVMHQRGISLLGDVDASFPISPALVQFGFPASLVKICQPTPSVLLAHVFLQSGPRLPANANPVMPVPLALILAASSGGLIQIKQASIAVVS
jgi:hypothetical protein